MRLVVADQPHSTMFTWICCSFTIQIFFKVIKCRASYPGFLAEMKREECRNKFIRTLEAPLKSARPLGIDVEKIKSDVTRRVEESQDLTEMKRTLEERAMQVSLSDYLRLSFFQGL
ncbi:hypothetical protein COOONC_13256 [Cooperia oncophora]